MHMQVDVHTCTHRSIAVKHHRLLLSFACIILLPLVTLLDCYHIFPFNYGWRTEKRGKAVIITNWTAKKAVKSWKINLHHDCSWSLGDRQTLTKRKKRNDKMCRTFFFSYVHKMRSAGRESLINFTKYIKIQLQIKLSLGFIIAS